MTMLPVSVLHKAVSTPRSTCRNTARHLQSPGSSGTANKAVSTHPIQQGQGKTPEARRRGRKLRLAPHTVCERRPICPEQQLNHGPYHRNGPGSAHQTTPPSDNTAALTSRTRGRDLAKPCSASVSAANLTHTRTGSRRFSTARPPCRPHADGTYPLWVAGYPAELTSHTRTGPGPLLLTTPHPSLTPARPAAAHHAVPSQGTHNRG